jgi:ubiquinone/menaquinone biosynthesis C-methylase UbiE
MTGATATGLLGDTPERSYGDKLERYSRFLEPELREIIAGLNIREGDRVLDAGCGSGLVASWLAERVGRSGSVVGVDLAHGHIELARKLNARPELPLRFEQGDVMNLSFEAASFDLVWTYNTINHLTDPVAGLRALAGTLAPSGCITLVQNLLLPEMIFAWDERLERAVIDSCRAYYRDKYGLAGERLAGQRNVYGWMLAAELADVSVRTIVVERVPPLSEADRAYFQHSVFEGHWGDKVRSYLMTADWLALQRQTNPSSAEYALARTDFHAIQTSTVVTGRVAAGESD